MAELRIYGGIGIPDEWGNSFTHADLVTFLDQNKDAESITVRINSPGGRVRTGNAIIETLQNSGKQINTVGEEIVGSMATQIFLVGDTRQLYPTTQFFLHNVQGGVIGSPADVEKYLADMKRDNEQLVSFYIQRTGIDRDTLTALLDNEVIITGREALQLGFATALIEPVAAYISKPQNMKLSEKIKALLQGKEVVNDLELSLENGEKLTISTAEELPGIGDAVKVAGATPADGAYALADKRIFVIEAGKISDIMNPVIEAPEEMAEDDEMEDESAPQNDLVQQLEQRIAELERRLSEQATAAKKEAEDLNETVLEMVRHLRSMTSGGVQPPNQVNFRNEIHDPRTLSEKVKAEKLRVGIPVK